MLGPTQIQTHRLLFPLRTGSPGTSVGRAVEGRGQAGGWGDVDEEGVQVFPTPHPPRARGLVRGQGESLPNPSENRVWGRAPPATGRPAGDSYFPGSEPLFWRRSIPSVAGHPVCIGQAAPGHGNQSTRGFFHKEEGESGRKPGALRRRPG